MAEPIQIRSAVAMADGETILLELFTFRLEHPQATAESLRNAPDRVRMQKISTSLAAPSRMPELPR